MMMIGFWGMTFFFVRTSDPARITVRDAQAVKSRLQRFLLCRRANLRANAGAAPQQRVELAGEAAPVVGADHVLLLAEVAVPRVGDRRHDDAVLDRPGEVHRAVV